MNKDIDVLFVCDYGQSRSPYFAKRYILETKGKELAAFCGVEDWTPRVLQKLVKRAKLVVLLSGNAADVMKASVDFENIPVYHNYIKDEPAILESEFRKWYELNCSRKS